MNEQEIKELEEKIVAQCEKRKAEGWEIGGWGGVYPLPNGGYQACALGSFANEGESSGDSHYTSIAARALGLTLDQARAFAVGFDGATDLPSWVSVRGGAPFFHLGQRVAARVLP